MIHLHDKDRIAVSKTRDCYLHPEEPGLVIKIAKRPSGRFRRNANHQEWQSWRYLRERFGHSDYFVICHGFVETTLGEGLMFDCVRDADGKVSRRLAQVLPDPAYDPDQVEDAVSGFCRYLMDRQIPLFDLNPFNILIQVLPDGNYRPVSIDTKGKFNNYETIPVSSYIPFFARRKVRRRCARLMEIIRQRRPA